MNFSEAYKLMRDGEILKHTKKGTSRFYIIIQFPTEEYKLFIFEGYWRGIENLGLHYHINSNDWEVCTEEELNKLKEEVREYV